MRFTRTHLVGLALLLSLVAGFAGITASPVNADAPVVHVVGWGDTLFSIAARYGTSVNALVQTNSLRNADFIWIGQRLVIPGTTAAPVPPPASTAYLVQSGDTLFSIATRYGTSVAALMQANGLYNYWIYAGQTLRIPGAPGVPIMPPPPAQGIYHIVRPGDYLSLIAAQYGTTVYAMQIANRLPNPSFIWTGQRLFVPGGVAPVNPPPVSLPPIVLVPVYPNYPPVMPYIPPTATPYIPSVVLLPTATPNPNSNYWEAVLVSNTKGTGPCSVAATVFGKTDWPVVVASTDGSYISDPKYTGSKPERGPYVVEFAHACTGTWRVIPLGLNTFADITLNGGHAEVEFRPR